MSAPPVVVAERVSRRFFLHRNDAHSLKERFLGVVHPSRRMQSTPFWALRDVSLAIRAGEAVGLVGRNGSGKSTLLKLIAGIHAPTEGRVLVRRGARVGSMIELGVGFHPELTGRENVYLNASVYGLQRREVDALYDRIVDYAGVGPFLEEPVKNFSSGMAMRLAFAVAAHLDPDVLLLDEIFAVGDADFQARCVRTMHGLAAAGRTILFVSHAPDAVRSLCSRVCVLDAGRLVFDGGVEDGLAACAEVAASPGGAGR